MIFSVSFCCDFSNPEICEVKKRLSEQNMVIRDLVDHIDTLKTQVESLRDPPVFFQCAFKDFFRNSSIPVDFNSIFSSFTNDWTVNGGIDLPSGQE